jgi:hypothetical protein
MPTAFIQRWHIFAYSTLMISLVAGAISLTHGLTETGLRIFFAKRWTISFIYPSLTVLLVVAIGLWIFNLIYRRNLGRTP